MRLPPQLRVFDRAFQISVRAGESCWNFPRAARPRWFAGQSSPQFDSGHPGRNHPRLGEVRQHAASGCNRHCCQHAYRTKSITWTGVDGRSTASPGQWPLRGARADGGLRPADPRSGHRSGNQQFAGGPRNGAALPRRPAAPSQLPAQIAAALGGAALGGPTSNTGRRGFQSLALNQSEGADQANDGADQIAPSGMPMPGFRRTQRPNRWRFPGPRKIRWDRSIAMNFANACRSFSNRMVVRGALVVAESWVGVGAVLAAGAAVSEVHPSFSPAAVGPLRHQSSSWICFLHRRRYCVQRRPVCPDRPAVEQAERDDQPLRRLDRWPTEYSAHLPWRQQDVLLHQLHRDAQPESLRLILDCSYAG